MRPIFATIHLGHLAHNYQVMKSQAGDSQMMAVVKANAYGHGLLPVSETLFAQGCRSFAVTDALEGKILREGLRSKDSEHIEIAVLSGIFDPEDADLCQRFLLSPVLSERSQLSLLNAANFSGNVWIKVDTGMHRIGAEDVTSFCQAISETPIKLAGIMSHLACADTPDHDLNQQQIQSFEAIQQITNSPRYSLHNSAGLAAFKAGASSTNITVRPGLALYGAEPMMEKPLGLKPVMQLSANIIQIRPIEAGDCVSYGATWQAETPTHIAVVAAGYADGLPRLLSNQGWVKHHSGRLPIVGRVCMDYCLLAVDASQVKTGESVIFFGFDHGAPLANDVAELAQTIAYELFTSISPRVQRLYLEDGGHRR
ncbi:MAG: alanine racemase [Zetaproteobacteria bacterium CG2_30_46_52]|nr:MAG: alanine racemase [Zetaproteobacteria bacterium CG2_30_46_52]